MSKEQEVKQANNSISFPIRLELTKGGSPKIVDRDGFSIANLSNTVHKHREPQGELIVTYCNSHYALKKENEELRNYANSVERLLKDTLEEAEKDYCIDEIDDVRKNSKISLLEELLTELKTLKP